MSTRIWSNLFYKSQNVVMLNVKKILLLLATIILFAGYDILYLTPIEDLRIFNIIAEFLFTMMSATLFLFIDSLKGKRFYYLLTIGFYLVFISMFVDVLDQFHTHDELYTALAEKATLLIGFTLVYFGMKNWIIEHALLNKKLETQAFTDELTGLYNRRGLLNKFESMNADAIKNNLAISFIIADLDDFKEYNDTLGHMSGDKFLSNIGRLLLSKMSQKEIIGRWGGEEFAICMLDSDLQKAGKFSEKIRLEVANIKLPAVMNKKSMTISLGVSEKQADESLMDAIKRADRSLYAAKRKGKNQTVTK